MPDDPPKIYWDACVFLSYINQVVDRLPHIDWYLKNSGKVHQIVTTTLSVAEVAFAEIEKNDGVLSNEIADKIDALWLSDDSPVRLSEPHLEIMLDARNIARKAIENRITTKVKGADVVHMATAMRLEVKEIHTYEPRWISYSAILGGIPIGPPICTEPELAFLPPLPPSLRYPSPAPEHGLYLGTCNCVHRYHEGYQLPQACHFHGVNVDWTLTLVYARCA